MTVRNHITSIYRNIAPAVIAVMLVMVGAVNFHTSVSFTPFFSAMAVYYWGVYWPDLMPKWFIFILGIFQDIVYGMPIGITSLLLLSFWWIIVSQRRHLIKEPFLVLWLVFSISVIVFALSTWFVYSIYFQRIIVSGTIIIEPLISIALYPCVHRLFNAVHRGTF